MHPSAFGFIEGQVAGRTFGSVVEFGSKDINGSVRGLFDCDYVGVDLAEGPGVDVVCDAADYRSDPVDAVVCTEVLEHAPDPEAVVANAARLLRPGGLFLVTAACDPRHPHSGIDGGSLQAGEWYRNIDPDLLAGWLAESFESFEVQTHVRGDVYAAAIK